METKYYKTQIEISIVEYTLLAKHEAYEKILESPPFDSLEGVLFLAGFSAELAVKKRFFFLSLSVYSEWEYINKFPREKAMNIFYQLSKKYWKWKTQACKQLFMIVPLPKFQTVNASRHFSLNIIKRNKK